MDVLDKFDFIFCGFEGTYPPALHFGSYNSSYELGFLYKFLKF
jgi:hypothetical protein